MTQLSGLLDHRARALFWLNVALLAGLVGTSALLYRLLPERYPIHFNLQGQPDRWASGDSLEWFLLPLVALLVVGFSLGLGLLLPRLPLRLWNLPHKERLLLWLGVVEGLFFLSLLVVIFRTASGSQLLPGLGLIGLGTVGLLAFIGCWVFRLLRLIDRLLADPP